MKPDGKYRMWSVATQNFLRLKENGDNIQAEFTGNGNEQSSEFTSIANTTNNPRVDENSWHLVFQGSDGTQYALHVNKQHGTFSFQPYTTLASAGIAAFVPESFGIPQRSPFKALKVASSQKCIACNKDGTLSLKTFKDIYPHPDTIFVISEVD
ncbi:hypothetical protein OS493_011201 [Desmophyllum pertusum]|uniref:Uncharacterized protein n=1 Tax=Desmophyllum pertusum TaxID=174260 RepID=A0A9W9Z259_9CNID|nr:hypothetical protein OS493_011201 [Desmophyllum pertusum]